jgi:outer membrane lipoprotein-sorting protein
MKMGKSRLSRLGVSMVAAAIGIFVFSVLGTAAEFSADLISKQAGETLTGKVYVKDDKIRQEFSREGETQVVILRMDKGVSWTLMADEKIYMEMPLGMIPGDPEIAQKAKDMAEKQYLGKEKVGGYVCKKYQFIYHDKSIGTLTQWFSKKLNYPLKTEHKSPSIHMLMEYRNIREKGLPDSLFEIPPGYQKMSMPMMPKGMPGGMGFPK